MLARNIPYFQRSPVESPGPEEHFGSGAHHVSTLTGEPAAGQYPLGIGGIPTLEKTQEGAGSGPKGTQLAMAATAVPPTSKFRDSSWCMPTDQGPGLIPGPPPPTQAQRAWHTAAAQERAATGLDLALGSFAPCLLSFGDSRA